MGNYVPAGGEEDGALDKLQQAQRIFEQASVDEDAGLGVLPYSLLLLHPDNDAVMSLQRNDLTRSLASYWTASSHNSCARGGSVDLEHTQRGSFQSVLTCAGLRSCHAPHASHCRLRWRSADRHLFGGCLYELPFEPPPSVFTRHLQEHAKMSRLVSCCRPEAAAAALQTTRD